MRAKVYLRQLVETPERKKELRYRVTKLVGTVDYWIGQELSYEHVADMCDAYGRLEVHIEGLG